ncbi:MAG: tetratricopeptide repeat protein [Nitrospirae bacterium]|nr:tetratricopeptide repeat protein [Nitrospirota bacterium]
MANGTTYIDKTIDVYIDSDGIRIDDKPTTARFPDHYLEKLRNGQRLEPAELETLGKNVYDNVFATQKRLEHLESLMADVGSQGLLTISIKTEEKEFHDIPFELMNRDGTKTGFLLQTNKVDIVRDVPSLNKKLQPMPVPVKMLVLLSLPLETYQTHPLDPLKELKVINRVVGDYVRCGLLEIDIEEKVSSRTIKERLRKKSYDIIHFSGHGSSGGYLVVEDEHDDRRKKLIEYDELTDLFKGSGVKLFYFDACETAQSEGFRPSLAYHIYRGIKSASVIANLASVYDVDAALTTECLYKAIFENRSFRGFLNPARLRIRQDWWKPVVYGQVDRIAFEEAGAKPVCDVPKRVLKRPEMPIEHYVYRYDIVRRASSLVENNRYLVLHGIGGAGKSTMAGYLSAFYDSKFRHILYFDLKEEGITEPEVLYDAILSECIDGEIVDGNAYTKLLKSIESLPAKNKVTGKWKFIKEIIAGKGKGKDNMQPGERVLLVLDNMEDTIQTRDGLIKKSWKDLIGELSSDQSRDNVFFTLLTSRLKPKLTDRLPLQHVLEIGEYSKADINFLLIELWQSGNSDNYAKYNFLAGSLDDIEKTFGYHPLSISYLIDKGFQDITELVKHPEMEKYLGFYRGYFERNRPEAERLLALEFPFSQEFLEKEFPAGFVDLVKNELLILKKAGELFSLYRVITTYFKEEFELKGDNLGRFAYQFIEGVKEKRYNGDDGLNVFIILIAYLQVLNDDNKRDKNFEAAVVFLFNGLERESKMKLRKESVESFASNLAGFQLEKGLYAQTLGNLGNLYWNTGRFEDAEKAYKEAEEYWRELAASNRDAYLPDLAMTLNNLGALYQNTGRFGDAEKAYKEAQGDYTELAISNRDAYLDNLAMTLNNLGVLYQNTGRFGDAEKAYKEAQGYRRELVATNRADYLPYLAGVLNNLGILYKDTGCFEDAEKALKEAVGYRRELAASNRDAYLPDLAMTLNNLGLLYADTGHFEDAEKAYKEAEGDYRELAASNRAAYLPDLAGMLNNLGNLYRNTGRFGDAEKTYKEAEGYRRELAASNRAAYLPDLAGTLNNLGLLYADTGRFEDAEKVYKEAEGDYRELAASNRAAYLPNLAATLNNLGNLYSDTGRFGDAGKTYKEAEEYKRELAAMNRAAYLPTLAMTLNNLGLLYSDTGRFGDAEKAYKEAEEYRRELADSNGAAYRPDLAMTLFNLGLLYADTDDRLAEAETHFKEALPMYESIKAHGDLIKLYPALIDVIQKARNSNLNDAEYVEITGYLCNFLEIYDIFFNKDRQKALAQLTFFREQKTFGNLDVNKIRANIKYPVHQSRFDSLLASIKAD